ncbi:MAG: hypothetical protein HY042_08290, partial [Spirochaetia bacterium]|nr:hypothetical protein [Spirochaetia bacterium]
MQAKADAFAALSSQVQAISEKASAERLEYAAAQERYTGTLNELAVRIRKLDAAQSDLARFRAVADFAETPYLPPQKTLSSDAHTDPAQDAQAQYERALSSYNAVQGQLREAGLAVETQDGLSDFYAVASGMAAGSTYDPLTDEESATLKELQRRKYSDQETLSGAEADRLSSLTARDAAQRYLVLIGARADYIKQAERTVRIEKAAAIVQNEIRVREAALAEKEKKFRNALDSYMPVESGNRAAEAARNAVYQRLSGVLKSGGSLALYQELRAWYFASQTAASQANDVWNNSMLQHQVPQTTPTQAAEALAGLGAWNSMSPADQADIRTFLSHGSLADFDGFASAYYKNVLQEGRRDVAAVNLQITIAAWTPTLYMGYATAVLGAGLGLIRTAERMIHMAVTALNWESLMWVATQYNAFQAASGTSIAAVQKAEEEFLEAKGSLDYFTKVPDMKTLKERLSEWGRQHVNEDKDAVGPSLYDLSDADLAYLVDEAGFVDQTGGSDANAVASVRAHALNVSSIKTAAPVVDGFGRAYNPDPSSMRDSQPGNLISGLYVDSDGVSWTRIIVTQNDGSQVIRYARLVGGTAVGKSYDMGRVLGMLKDHGERLRDTARAAYVQSGSSLEDKAWVMNERDATTAQTLRYAVSQGRQYAGYALAWNDYQNNAD